MMLIVLIMYGVFLEVSRRDSPDAPETRVSIRFNNRQLVARILLSGKARDKNAIRVVQLNLTRSLHEELPPGSLRKGNHVEGRAREWGRDSSYPKMQLCIRQPSAGCTDPVHYSVNNNNGNMATEFQKLLFAAFTPDEVPVVEAEVTALVTLVGTSVFGEFEPVDVLTRFIVDVPLPQPISGVNVVTSRSL